MRMSQLQYNDCITIETLLKVWRKANTIADYIWVNKSTISNELRKYSENWKYNGTIAWTKRQLLRTLKNKEKKRIEKWSKIEKYIKTYKEISITRTSGRYTKKNYMRKIIKGYNL